MVVNNVIWNWITLVFEDKAGPEVFGQAVQWLGTFFYAYYGILYSPQPAHLQVALDILKLFLICSLCTPT